MTLTADFSKVKRVIPAHREKKASREKPVRRDRLVPSVHREKKAKRATLLPMRISRPNSLRLSKVKRVIRETPERWKISTAPTIRQVPTRRAVWLWHRLFLFRRIMF